MIYLRIRYTLEGFEESNSNLMTICDSVVSIFGCLLLKWCFFIFNFCFSKHKTNDILIFKEDFRDEQRLSNIGIVINKIE